MNRKQWFDLSDKVVVVTGASQGLGASISKTLAAHGATVVIAARSKVKLEKVKNDIVEEGGDAIIFEMDVTDRDSVEQVDRKLMDQFGRIDILVNNAGAQIESLFLELSFDEWKQVMDVNLNGVFHCCQVFGKHFVEQKSGKIINIASIASQSGIPYQVPYSTSKAGVALMTKALAVEWARYGVNVNAIAPGYFNTSMPSEVLKDPKKSKNLLRGIPLRRVGKLNEIGPLAVYLSSTASDFMTGEIVYLDGGFTAR